MVHVHLKPWGFLVYYKLNCRFIEFLHNNMSAWIKGYMRCVRNNRVFQLFVCLYEGGNANVRRQENIPS